MRTPSVSKLRRAAMLVAACLGLLLLAGTDSAMAQLCQPCNAGGTYKIILGPTWHLQLGNPSLQVKVQDLQSGAVTTQTTSNMQNGMSYTNTFPNNPGHTYAITSVTLVTTGGTILDVYCDTSSPVIYPIGNPKLCVKFTFTAGISPDCYTIRVEVVSPTSC